MTDDDAHTPSATEEAADTEVALELARASTARWARVLDKLAKQ